MNSAFAQSIELQIDRILDLFKVLRAFAMPQAVPHCISTNMFGYRIVRTSDQRQAGIICVSEIVFIEWISEFFSLLIPWISVLTNCWCALQIIYLMSMSATLLSIGLAIWAWYSTFATLNFLFLIQSLISTSISSKSAIPASLPLRLG